SLLRPGYVLGPTQWTKQNFECAWCNLSFTCPADLEPRTWKEWLAANGSNVARYPFLSDIAKRIDEMLEGTRPYGPVDIKLEPLACPRCHLTMSLNPEPNGPMGCPACGELSGVSDDGSGDLTTVGVDAPWPPIV